MNGTINPHPHDVVCCRGRHSNRHVGNANFRGLVKSHRALYVTLTKREKTMMTKSIVQKILSQNPPGRFLQKDTETSLWYDIGLPRALEKTSQALREKYPRNSNGETKQKDGVLKSKTPKNTDQYDSSQSQKLWYADGSSRSAVQSQYQEHSQQCSSPNSQSQVHPSSPTAVFQNPSSPLDQLVTKPQSMQLIPRKLRYQHGFEVVKHYRKSAFRSIPRHSSRPFQSPSARHSVDGHSCIKQQVMSPSRMSSKTRLSPATIYLGSPENTYRATRFPTSHREQNQTSVTRKRRRDGVEDLICEEQCVDSNPYQRFNERYQEQVYFPHGQQSPPHLQRSVQAPVFHPRMRTHFTTQEEYWGKPNLIDDSYLSSPEKKRHRNSCFAPAHRPLNREPFGEYRKHRLMDKSYNGNRDEGRNGWVNVYNDSPPIKSERFHPVMKTLVVTPDSSNSSSVASDMDENVENSSPSIEQTRSQFSGLDALSTAANIVC